MSNELIRDNQTSTSSSGTLPSTSSLMTSEPSPHSAPRSWLCLKCSFNNALRDKYCSVCGKWRWEEEVMAATRLPGDELPKIPLTPPSSPSSSPPPHDLLPSSGGSSSTDAPTSTETLEEKCPQPHPSVSVVELPWDLELLYDRGRTLLMKISVRRNPKKAWELLQRAAVRGHPAAQWDVHLKKTNEDEIDWDRAVEYYVEQMTTSTQYSAVAAFCLGCCFLGGWGVEREEEKAVTLYKAAVRKGYLKGLNEVGWIYDHGLGGVPRDSVAAFRCFKILAKRGYALAQYNTARCFRDGRGGEVNWKKGVKWFGRASMQGYHNAQRSLAHIYQTGVAREVGVKRDLIRAMELYREAASNGDPAGVHKIMELTKNTKMGYEGNKATKEPVPYFEEIKKKGIGSPEDRKRKEELESKSREEEKEKKVEIGEYWVPKLFDQCCMVLWKGGRDMYMDANIPMNVKKRIESEGVQCSGGCGTIFFGKGRVTRTFAEKKLMKKRRKLQTSNGGSKSNGEGEAFSDAKEAEPMWKYTGRQVSMHYCSKTCAEGFFSQGSLWEF